MSNWTGQVLCMNQGARAVLKNQKPACVWFTGLSGAGKTTLGKLLEQQLWLEERHTYMLDGDLLRAGLNKDLKFSEADRKENVRRVAEVARLMVDAGLIVIVTLISPFRADRDYARSLFKEGEFLEVYLETPIEVCAERDPKGLYARAMKGEILDFTGISSPYEPPFAPELVLSTVNTEPYRLVESIMKKLETR